jgi:hypothetical protein
MKSQNFKHHVCHLVFLLFLVNNIAAVDINNNNLLMKETNSIQTSPTIASLLEQSSTTEEAATLLRNHHEMKFLIENLEKHDVKFDQILIDLHHGEGKAILQARSAKGTCEPSSWKYYASCFGMNSACKSSKNNPCQGICRCNTVGADECECVKSLSEPEKEDDTFFFAKTVKVASKDMKKAGQKIIKKADEAIDKLGDKISDVVDKGIDFVKKNVIGKIVKFLHTFKTSSKHTVKRQKEKVENAKSAYYAAKGKEEKRAALLKLSHAIGKLNGMQQIVAIKTTLKKALSILKGGAHLVLPDMLILGANYGSTLGHTAGVEHVYDFRTREVAFFTFGGINIGTNQLNALMGKSIGASAGVYLALGWQHAAWCKSLEDKYSGLFKTVDFSVEVPGFSIPSFASINMGGVAAVSASGYGGAMGKCCPLFSEIKTVGFSASASIGLGKSPIPFDAGMGCTDYDIKKTGKICKESLLGFIKTISIMNAISPINLLLTVGLALANDFRAAPNVCGANFKSPQKCSCQGLPNMVECCGNRPCHACKGDEYDKGFRVIKQREIGKMIKKVRNDVVDDVKSLVKGGSKLEAVKHVKKYWKELLGAGDSKTLKKHKKVDMVCDRKPLLKRGSRGDDVKALQRLLGYSEKGIDGIFGRGTKSKVLKFQESVELKKTDGIVGKMTWYELCKNKFHVKYH